MTVGELAEAIGRSPSATSRLVDGLVRRRLVERRTEEPEDRRQRTLRLTQRGQALLRVVDRARADQFLSAVRPLPTAERAIVAMGVAALATHAISRRGRLIKATATSPADLHAAGGAAEWRPTIASRTCRHGPDSVELPVLARAPATPTAAWGAMVEDRAHHDPAAHDPERELESGGSSAARAARRS